MIATPLSPTEAARMAGCHPNSIYAALTAGELKGYQRTAPKGRWKIFPEDLEKWIRHE